MIMNLLTLFVCINIPMGMLSVAGTPFYVNGTDNCFFPSSGAPGVDPTVNVPTGLFDIGLFSNGTATLSQHPTLVNDKVDSVAVTLGGNYTSDPTVSFSGGGGTGASATLVTGNITNGFEVLSISVTDGGNSYTSAPTVSFVGGAPVNVTATAIATIGNQNAGNTLTINGLVYTGVVGVKANNTQWSVDTDDTTAATDLADSITFDGRTGLTVPFYDVAATSNGAVVTITSTSKGIDANSIDLSENTGGTTIVVSGALLTGGLSPNTSDISSTLQEFIYPTNSTLSDPNFGDSGVLNNFFDTVDQAAKSMEVLKHVISGTYITDTIGHFVISCSYNATGHLVVGNEHAVWTGLKAGIQTLVMLLMVFTLFYWATGRGHILTS